MRLNAVITLKYRHLKLSGLDKLGHGILMHTVVLLIAYPYNS